MNREALERLGHDSLVDLVLRQEEVLEEYVERLEDLENQVKDLTPGPLGPSPAEIRQRQWPGLHGITTTQDLLHAYGVGGMTTQDLLRGAEALAARGPRLAQHADAQVVGVQRKDHAPREQYTSHPVPPHSAEQDDTARPCRNPWCPTAFHSADHPHTKED